MPCARREVDTLLTTIAQISDPHVGLHADYADSVEALERAVAAVGEMDPVPVAVLLTGDLTFDGNPAEYEVLRELLEPLEMPVHPIPGNHDRRENLRAAFSDHPGIAGAGRFLDYVVDCISFEKTGIRSLFWKGMNLTKNWNALERIFLRISAWDAGMLPSCTYPINTTSILFSRRWPLIPMLRPTGNMQTTMIIIKRSIS
jgi:predicted MPP superfamily phosphohydrolase